MSDTTKPGDPADKAADGAFGGVTSHRAGYGDQLARVEEWLRKHPSATLASGEGAVLIQEIDQLRRQILIFVDMAATWVKVGHENERLQDAIERVRALHAPQEYTIWSGARLQRCTHCRDESGYCVPYPCPTLRALDGEDA
jgi:hypothetical protein